MVLVYAVSWWLEPLLHNRVKRANAGLLHSVQYILALPNPPRITALFGSSLSPSANHIIARFLLTISCAERVNLD